MLEFVRFDFLKDAFILAVETLHFLAQAVSEVSRSERSVFVWHPDKASCCQVKIKLEWFGVSSSTETKSSLGECRMFLRFLYVCSYFQKAFTGQPDVTVAEKRTLQQHYSPTIATPPLYMSPLCFSALCKQPSFHPPSTFSLTFWIKQSIESLGGWYAVTSPPLPPSTPNPTFTEYQAENVSCRTSKTYLTFFLKINM